MRKGVRVKLSVGFGLALAADGPPAGGSAPVRDEPDHGSKRRHWFPNHRFYEENARRASPKALKTAGFVVFVRKRIRFRRFVLTVFPWFFALALKKTVLQLGPTLRGKHGYLHFRWWFFPSKCVF